MCSHENPIWFVSLSLWGFILSNILGSYAGHLVNQPVEHGMTFRVLNTTRLANTLFIVILGVIELVSYHKKSGQVSIWLSLVPSHLIVINGCTTPEYMAIKLLVLKRVILYKLYWIPDTCHNSFWSLITLSDYWEPYDTIGILGFMNWPVQWSELLE